MRTQRTINVPDTPSLNHQFPPDDGSCCLCGTPREPGNRYVCRQCGESGAAIASAALERDRAISAVNRRDR